MYTYYRTTAITCTIYKIWATTQYWSEKATSTHHNVI